MSSDGRRIYTSLWIVESRSNLISGIFWQPEILHRFFLAGDLARTGAGLSRAWTKCRTWCSCLAWRQRVQLCWWHCCNPQQIRNDAPQAQRQEQPARKNDLFWNGRTQFQSWHTAGIFSQNTHVLSCGSCQPVAVDLLTGMMQKTPKSPCGQSYFSTLPCFEYAKRKTVWRSNACNQHF